VITAEAKAPEKKPILRSIDHDVTVGFVKRMPNSLTIKMPEEPLSSIACTAKVQWVHSTGTWLHPNAPKYTQWRPLTFTKVEHTSDGYFVHLITDEIIKIVDEERLASKANLTIRIQYVPAIHEEI